jgi:hypothetical protein
MNREYTKIIERLQGAKQRMAERGLMETQTADAFDEAMDIIYDYERAALQTAELLNKYETVKDAIDRGMGVNQCPDCMKMISYGNEHCHWCGRKLGWNPRTRGKRGKGKNGKDKHY